MESMNRRNFFKFLAKGAAIVGAAGVLGLPEAEAKEYKYEFNHMLWEATITDSNDNIVEVYQLRDYVIYGADKFVEKLRQDYIKYDLVELKDWADDIEQSLVGSFDGLNDTIFTNRDRDNDIINKHAFDDYLKNDSNNLVWTTEQRKQFAREVIELEKELPELMPMWENGILNHATQNLENLEISVHKASNAMKKFYNALEDNELDGTC